MIEVLTSVLPIFLLILLGWLLKRSPLLREYGWTALERLTYFVLFPCLLATTLAEADFSELPIKGIAAAIIGAIVIVSLLLFAMRRFLFTDGPRFTSVYQGSVRMNTYVGLSIAATFYAETGLAAAALAIAIIVPLVNVACVLMLAMYGNAAGNAARQGWQGVLDAWVKNPLIIGSFIGLALNISGLGLPPLVGPMAEILAEAALPLGLLAVGAALHFNAVLESGVVVLATSVIKLVVLPLLTWGLLRLFGVEGVEADVAILFNALPTATSAYILASQFGGDAKLMASIISVETLLSMISLSALLAWLM
ncbi:MAG: AEC family transporter [Bythopirellula sp.]|nr:AEC family transporter [Bythopirellula sp.]